MLCGDLNEKEISVLCDDLDGWNGGGVGGRSKREGTGMYIADSLRCTAETNRTL